MNVIGVDVGTTSVRLAIISFRGEDSQGVLVLSSHEKEIGHHQEGTKYEQNSQEIWDAVCYCSREALRKSNLPGSAIRGIAFSATCSLVIEDSESSRLKYANDVIMWMDHRAIEEAQSITESGSKVLNRFGGVCSPEFSLSKLLWLQKHEPARFETAIGFFELPDWLVYRSIGSDPEQSPRSICCLTCKWGFDVDENCHCSHVKQLESNKIGTKIYGPGKLAGFLSRKSAKELGLIDEAFAYLNNKENTEPKFQVAVGTSLIDAHSGLLAMLSLPLQDYGIKYRNIESTFCSLAGTSSCHMLLSKQSNFVKGIWGPYKDVVLDKYYLLEAGQSLTGKLIEISIATHEEGKAKLSNGKRLYDVIQELNQGLLEGNFSTDLLLLPFFHGNRSPLANPRLMGGVYGLKASGARNLLEYYVATIEAICYETRSIVETLNSKLDIILVSGGLMKNAYYMQTLANVLNCNVIKMSLEEIDFMVMGSALVARQAVKNSSGNNDDNRPLTVASIENIHYEQLYALEKYEPQLVCLLHKVYSIELDLYDPNYDPENQDGIPVLSARGSRLNSPKQWSPNDQDPYKHPFRSIRKRQSDYDESDPDDDDNDARGSGSVNHDSYENPSYGESTRAAKDGDDIESFFDKHLGPPSDALESASTDDTQYLVPNRSEDETPYEGDSVKDDRADNAAKHIVDNGSKDDDEDDFDVAASSPLSALFHTLIDGHKHHHHFHHKRPLIITSSAPSSASPEDTSTNQQSASSASSPVGQQQLVAGSSQSNAVAGATGPAPIAPNIVVPASPLAFLTALPAASTNVYDQSSVYGPMKPLASEEGPQAVKSDDFGGGTPIRTIYIGRRPIIQYVRHSSPTISHATGATHLSNAYMRGSGMPMIIRGGGGDQAYEAAMSDYRMRPMMPSGSAADYHAHRYPPGMDHGASEGGYPSDESSDANDEQTVSYGLSFRRRPSSYLSSSDEGSGSIDESRASEYDQPPSGYYRPNYGPMPSTSTNNAYAAPSMPSDAYRYSRYREPTGDPPMTGAYGRSNAVHMQHRGPVMDHFAGSKYHKDPSESAPEAYPGHYAKYKYRSRQGDSGEYSTDQSDWSQRQRLLASLNQELKSAPMLKPGSHYMNAGTPATDGSIMQRAGNGDIVATMNGQSMESMYPYMRPANADAQSETTSRESEGDDASGGGSSGGNNLQTEGSIRVPSRLDSKSSNSSSTLDNGNLTNFSIGQAHSLSQLGMNGPNDSTTGSNTNPSEAPRGSGEESSSGSTDDNAPRQRVRREDSDDREADADDEDGVWVDDDGDDDNGQQSSDVNETAQDPDNENSDDNQVDTDGQQMRPSQQGMIASPHGYELSPNDLMIYHGR